jgi:hypothetical protein
MLGFLLIVVLAALVVASIPRWPHSRSWSFGPSGVLSVLLVVVLILVLLGRV